MINVDDEMLENGNPVQPILSFDKMKGSKKQQKYLTPGTQSPIKIVSDSPNHKSVSSDTIMNLHQANEMELFPSKPQLDLKVANQVISSDLLTKSMSQIMF